MEQLSTNYLDYLKLDESDEIGYFTKSTLKDADWLDRKEHVAKATEKQIALYLLVTGNSETPENEPKFLELSNPMQERIKKLILRYIKQYHKNKKVPVISFAEDKKDKLAGIADEDLTYEHIKDLDWNKKSEISAKTIIQVFKNLFVKMDTSTQFLWMNQFQSLKPQRMSEIAKQLEKANFPLFEKNLWKEHAAEDFTKSYLYEYLDDGDIQLFIYKKYIKLFYNTTQRGLPLKDKEASRQYDKFIRARSTMVDLLKRSGKIKDAFQVRQMILKEKPYTLDSYLTEKIDIIALKMDNKFPSLTQTKQDNILIELKKEIKKKYTEQYEQIESIVLKNKSNKYVKESVELRQLVCLLMSIDALIRISKVKKAPRKLSRSLLEVTSTIESVPYPKAGLGLAESFKHKE